MKLPCTVPSLAPADEPRHGSKQPLWNSHTVTPKFSSQSNCPGWHPQKLLSFDGTAYPNPSPSSHRHSNDALQIDRHLHRRTIPSHATDTHPNARLLPQNLRPSRNRPRPSFATRSCWSPCTHSYSLRLASASKREAEAFGAAIGDWPTLPDSAPACCGVIRGLQACGIIQCRLREFLEKLASSRR